MVAVCRRTHSPRSLFGGESSPYSLREPGEHCHWLSHDDSTMNIGTGIVVVVVIIAVLLFTMS